MNVKSKFSDSDLQQLVSRCKSLPPAKGDYLVHDYVENLLLTVLDYQLQGVTIGRAMEYYRQHARTNVADFASLVNLLSTYPDDRDGNQAVAQYLWGYNYWNRVVLLRRFVAYFAQSGVTTQEQLKQWANESNFDRDFKGKVKGAGYAIYQWLIMRQGIETIKPDLWIHRFVQDVLGYAVSDQMAVDLLERVAREMGVKAYELDWRIWENQSGRS
jgi:hypothetical protein